MYLLTYPKHTDPDDDKDRPAGAWLIDGDNPPLNMLRNEVPDSVPTIDHPQDPHLARRHVTALRAAWELRQKATAKVAG